MLVVFSGLPRQDLESVRYSLVSLFFRSCLARTTSPFAILSSLCFFGIASPGPRVRSLFSRLVVFSGLPRQDLESVRHSLVSSFFVLVFLCIVPKRVSK